MGFIVPLPLMHTLLASPSSPQTSLYYNHGPAGAAGAAPATRLPLVPWAALAHLRNLGSGAFGDVALMDWSAHGLTVAVKCNGTDSVDGATIDNERRLYELLLSHPHDNIMPVYGICTDAPDGKVRLVMKYSAKGSLDKHLTGTAKPEVGASVEGGWPCVVTSGSTWSSPTQQPVASALPFCAPFPRAACGCPACYPSWCRWWRACCTSTPWASCTGTCGPPTF
jgi:hypothetical protein